MKRMGLWMVIGFSLPMTGCSLFGHQQPQVRQTDPDARYREVDVGRLVGYGGEVAGMSDAARQAECQHLARLGKKDQSLGLRLHLVALQGVTSDCGPVEEALATLRSSRGEIKDQSLWSWVQYQEQLLGRLEREAEYRKEMEQKAKQASEKAQRIHRQAKSKETQLKTLQDKLDALKSIEQGQTLGGPQGER